MFLALYLARQFTVHYFLESTITGVVYLYTLRRWLMPQIQEDSVKSVCVQDGAPALHHIGFIVYENILTEYSTVLEWPCSPAMTLSKLFFWSIVKDDVLVLALTANLLQLRERIITAVVTTDQIALQSLVRT